METFTVTSHFSGDINDLFLQQGGTKLLPKDYLGMKFDLAILAGGSDINPQLYGKSSKGGMYDDSRDKREFDFIMDVITGRVIVKKVLGLCRGLQMINVALGGTLIFDILQAYGESHRYSHPIRWTESTAFSGFLTTVNSMHHQALSNIGNKRDCKILAIEPNTQVVEMAMWGNKFLGTQFHPEFFPDTSEEKAKFADIIEKWVNGETEIVQSSNRRYQRSDWTPSLPIASEPAPLEIDWDDSLPEDTEDEEDEDNG